MKITLLGVAAGSLLMLTPGLLAAGQLPQPDQEPDVEVAELSAEDVLAAQLDAFNRQDVEALTANLSEDFAWFAVDSNTTTVELRGRDAFRRSMQAYFRSVPSAHATIEAIVPGGPFVAVYERAFWTDNRSGEELSQASIAVYEVRDGLIYRVWYYPSSR